MTLGAAVALSGIVILAGAAAEAGGRGEGHTPVTICHWVPADGGRYIEITVDDDGSSGNNSLQAHLAHEHDIIPAPPEGCPGPQPTASPVATATRPPSTRTAVPTGTRPPATGTAAPTGTHPPQTRTVVPTGTAGATRTVIVVGSITPQASATRTLTATAVPTATDTPTPTQTPGGTATHTAVPTATDTPTPTQTVQPTATHTAVPTAT
ncbi:MAG TPA: hypothetical protein VFX28_12590, partial [Methylomirabilota bacterium]|nr:hypothetical protein [Methylomirabilota bacterium]